MRNSDNNPFVPGAGSIPAVLAGREEFISAAQLAIRRTVAGYPEQGIVFHGLRGVGKTVLLNHIGKHIRDSNLRKIFIEVQERQSFPEMVVAELRELLLGMSVQEKVLQRAKQALLGFAKGLKVSIGDMAVEYSPGIADNGNIELDMQTLFEAIGAAAAEQKIAIIFVIDEMQYLNKAEKSALCVSFHKAVQRGLPMLLLGAGLPQLLGQLGDAKSYAERLFVYRKVDSLTPEAARQALEQPAAAASVKFAADALDEIIKQTCCYPYFLQEWGKQIWNVSQEPLITIEQVAQVAHLAQDGLDEGFFKVRFDRLTRAEKRYVHVMAELIRREEDPRAGEIAKRLQQHTRSLGPTRAKLITKGIAYSPAHGDIAFTVPMFEDFVARMNLDIE